MQNKYEIFAELLNEMREVKNEIDVLNKRFSDIFYKFVRLGHLMSEGIQYGARVSSFDPLYYKEGDSVFIVAQARHSPKNYGQWCAVVDVEVNGGYGEYEPEVYGYFDTAKEAIACAEKYLP